MSFLKRGTFSEFPKVVGSFGLAGPGAAFSCGAAWVEEANKDEEGAFGGLEV